MLDGVAPRTRDLTNPGLIGAAVAKRRAHLQLGQEELGVGRSTVSLLETGKQTRYQLAKLVAVGRGLQWPDDWIERVEAGENLTRYVEVSQPAAVGDDTRSDQGSSGTGSAKLTDQVARLAGAVDRLTERVEALEAERRRRPSDRAVQ